MDKDFAKQSSLMKFEAMALFAGVKAMAATDRWWYFAEMRRVGRQVRIDQSISAYHASLYWNYVFRGIDCQLYLERDAHQERIGENVWKLSFSAIEGKVHALTLHDFLKPLQQEGFYIPNGNENLERQMNFSLGLYGACLMHVDVIFPHNKPPQQCVNRVLDMLEAGNRDYLPIEQVLAEMDQKRADALAGDENDNPDIMMGDWQTWK